MTGLVNVSDNYSGKTTVKNWYVTIRQGAFGTWSECEHVNTSINLISNIVCLSAITNMAMMRILEITFDQLNIPQIVGRPTLLLTEVHHRHCGLVALVKNDKWYA